MTSQIRLSKNQIILLGIIFLLVRGFAFYQAISHPESIYTRDSYEYKNAAMNLIEHGILYSGDLLEETDPALYSRRPPGYPLFLYVSQLFSSSDLLIIILQNILNILVVIIILKILIAFQISHQTVFWTIIIFLVYPTQIIYTQLIMSEILLQTLLMASLFFIIEYFQTKKQKFLLLFNLLLSAAVLVKPVLMYFWLVNIIFHLWIFKLHRHRLILIMPLLMIITVGGWSLRNYSVTRYFHFSSIKTFNLLYYNTSSFLVNHYGAEDARQTIGKIDSISQTLSFPEANRYIEEQCFGIIKDNWLAYGIYHLRGVFFFFIDPGRYDIYQFFEISQDHGFFRYITIYGLPGILKLLKEIPLAILVTLGLIFTFNIFLFMALIFFYFKVPTPLYLKSVILVFILYFAIISGPLGWSRLRLPLFPLFILIFGLSLQFFLLKYRISKSEN
jgi:hypothetical protein